MMLQQGIDLLSRIVAWAKLSHRSSYFFCVIFGLSDFIVMKK